MAVSGKVWCTENLRRPDVLHLTLTKPASTALECGTARPDLSAACPQKGTGDCSCGSRKHSRKSSESTGSTFFRKERKVCRKFNTTAGLPGEYHQMP